MARSRRAPFGSDSTGLPASDEQGPDLAVAFGLDLLGQAATAGSSPKLSGSAADPAGPAADDRAPAELRRPSGVGRRRRPAWANMAPPGRSRWPATMLSASTSQEAMVPNGAVVVPMRP